MTTPKPTSRNFWRVVLLSVALAVAAYQWGLHVQASADATVMRQHLADDSIDNETVWQICTPRRTP